MLYQIGLFTSRWYGTSFVTQRVPLGSTISTFVFVFDFDGFHNQSPLLTMVSVNSGLTVNRTQVVMVIKRGFALIVIWTTRGWLLCNWFTTILDSIQNWSPERLEQTITSTTVNVVVMDPLLGLSRNTPSQWLWTQCLKWLFKQLVVKNEVSRQRPWCKRVMTFVHAWKCFRCKTHYSITVCKHPLKGFV